MKSGREGGRERGQRIHTETLGKISGTRNDRNGVNFLIARMRKEEREKVTDSE